MKLALTPDQHTASLAQSRRRGVRGLTHQWQIEGEHLTTEEIGRRLGCSTDAARRRLHRVRVLPGVVTWAGLS